MKKTLLFTLIAFVSTVGVFAGAEAESSSSEIVLSRPGTYPIVSEPQTITVIGTYDSRNNSGTPEDAGFTLYLEELTGIHLDWLEMIEHLDAVQKWNLILASGDLPELAMPFSPLTAQQVYQHGRNGSFLALNDFLDERMPSLKQRLSEAPEIVDRITMPDGNIYSVPDVEYDCYHCQYSSKMWVYQPWLDKLGIDRPETTEEFADMLRAFRDGDPNGNGLNDEIPLLGAVTGWRTNIIGFLMNSFVYAELPYDANYGAFLERSPNDVRFVANTPEWREGLRYLRLLNSEGLLASESFSWQEAQAKQTTENPEYPLVGAFPGGWFGRFTIHGGGTGRFADFRPVVPLLGPKGVRQTNKYPAAMRFHSQITSEAKNPAMIAQWLDWFYEDPIANSALMWGFWKEGSEWRYLTEDEKAKGWVARDGSLAKTIKLHSTVYSLDILDDGWTRTGPHWSVTAHEAMPPEWEGDPTRVEWRLMVATRDLYEPHAGDKWIPADLIFDESIQDEQIDLAEVITSKEGLVMQRAAEFILGRKNIDSDSDWDAYLAELKRAGVDRYVELWKQALVNGGYL